MPVPIPSMQQLVRKNNQCLPPRAVVTQRRLAGSTQDLGRCMIFGVIGTDETPESKLAASFFDGRTVIRAEDLKGPRVYSTDLLPSNFGGSDDFLESASITARALKIKIITKGLVTLNSIYLVSPLAVKLMDDHPGLLEGDAILPAFRIGNSGLRDLVTSTEGHESVGIDSRHLDEHISKVEKSIKQVMPWDASGIGDKYRESLSNGLRNFSSPISKELAKRGLILRDVETLATEIESLDFNQSVNIHNYVANRSEIIREPLKKFATACYHIIGTGVVRCETGTDLNPLSGFKATDLVLTARDTHPELLSDEAVFLEAFMGFALDTIQSSALPTQIVDSLSFEMAHRISAALRAQGFQQKYDEVTYKYVTSLANKDPKEALEQLDEGAVASVASELANTFKSEILRELPGYETAIQEGARGDLYRAGTDIAHDVASAIPVLGTIVAVADVFTHAAEFAGTGSKARSVRTQQDALIQAQKQKAEKIQNAIYKLAAGNEKKTTLLDAVAMLSDVHGIAISRA